MEQVVEWGRLQVSVLLVHLGQHDWSHGDLALQGSLLGGLVIGDLG